MTSLTYLALEDADLQDAARHLPLTRLEIKHLSVHALHEAKTHEIVAIHRADGQRELKNTFEGRRYQETV